MLDFVSDYIDTVVLAISDARGTSYIVIIIVVIITKIMIAHSSDTVVNRRMRHPQTKMQNLIRIANTLTVGCAHRFLERTLSTSQRQIESNGFQ